MQKNDLRAVVETGEPLVVIVASQKGLERSFVLYEEDSADSLEAGNLLLAKIAPQLVLLDAALKQRP